MRGSSVGRRIKLYRLRRGMTQEVLAGRVGRSTSWLSQVERGILGIESWRAILDLSEVLRVDPRWLVGRPLDLAPNGGVTFEAVIALRAALTDYSRFIGSVPDEDRPVNPARIEAGVETANGLYQRAHYEEAGVRLAELVGLAENASSGATSADARVAARVLAKVYQATSKTLTKVGETELAWVAADRALVAARAAEDPDLLAASAYHIAHVFLRGGRLDESIEIAVRASDAVAAETGMGREQRSLIGSLALTAAIAAARKNDRSAVRSMIGTAEQAAEVVIDDANDYWMAFGPTNVAIHRLAVAVELGEPGEAIRIGEGIDASKLPTGLIGRRLQVPIELARAYTQRRMDAAAVNMLGEAERIAPETVRYNGIVRDLLRQLLKREHRPTTPELRPLAERLGVLD